MRIPQIRPRKSPVCLGQGHHPLSRDGIGKAHRLTFGENEMSVAPPFALGVTARLLRAGMHGLDLASLRQLIVGAEPIRADVLRAFAQAAEPYGFDATAISPAYGLAEATVGVSMTHRREYWSSERVDAEALGEGWWSPERSTASNHRTTEVVSCGTPLRGVEVRVERDGDDHDVGNIALRSPSMFTGNITTIGTPEARSDDSWFTTGDLGFVAPSGELFIVGRSDDMIFAAGSISSLTRSRA